MPYPESCPECGGAFRNSGTHFTARRNEIGRHVLLELGCQNTSRRYWWDFTTGSLTESGRTVPARRASSLTARHNGTTHAAASAVLITSDHTPRLTLSALDRPDPTPMSPHNTTNAHTGSSAHDTPETRDQPATPSSIEQAMASLGAALRPTPPAESPTGTPSAEAVVSAPTPSTLQDAFVRQLQLDRLTLRQMRSWVMADDARRTIEVAAGATEATYERLALILFGSELSALVGQPAPVQTSGLSAEQRLELQREKARLRARARRAAARTARHSEPA